jgi:hypothetical protein
VAASRGTIGDTSVIRARYDSIKRYVDFLPTPTSCPSCKSPTNTATHPPNHSELPWYYMNGDWMEYEPQDQELAQSGPLLSSFHYILDVTLLGEMAEILGRSDDATKYAALARRLWPAFNDVYLGIHHAPKVPPGACECSASREVKKGGRPLDLGCGPTGGLIDSIQFCAFGTPAGNCSSGFVHNPECDDHGEALKAAEKLCVGKARCTLVPTVGPGGIIPDDPCQGVIKTLAVKVYCKASPAPSPAPTPPAPAPPSPPLYRLRVIIIPAGIP